MKLNRLFQRLLAGFLALALVVPYSVYAAETVSISSPAEISFKGLSNFEVPENLGTLDSQFQAAVPGPSYVLIQDAHAVQDAQSSIQKLIRYFEQHYGFSAVGIEGGSGPLDATLLKNFPDEFIRTKVMKQYFERGELTGADMAAIEDKQASYQGLEDWGLYEAHYRAWFEAEQNQKAAEEQLARVRKEWDQKRQNIYSPELNAFHEKCYEFYHDKVPFANFVRFLNEASQKKSSNKFPQLSKLIDSLEKEEKLQTHSEIIDVSLRRAAKVFESKFLPHMNREQQMDYRQKLQAYMTGRMDPASFLNVLIEAGEKLGQRLKLNAAMESLLGHARTLSMIRGTELFEEMEIWIDQIEQGLIQSEAEKSLAQDFRRLDLLDSLGKLELTRKQWEELQVLDKGGEDLPLKAHKDFYALALKRDQALFENAMKMKKGGLIVAGGFHARGLTELFREKNISYAVVQPQMNSLSGQETYSKVMNGDVSYKTFLKRSHYEAFMTHAVIELMKQMNEPDFRKNYKFWRDEIIRALSKEGRVEQAGRYTKFLDHLSKTYYDQFGMPQNRTRLDVLQSMQGAFDSFVTAYFPTTPSTLALQSPLFPRSEARLRAQARNVEILRSQMAEEIVKAIMADLPQFLATMEDGAIDESDFAAALIELKHVGETYETLLGDAIPVENRITKAMETIHHKLPVFSRLANPEDGALVRRLVYDGLLNALEPDASVRSEARSESRPIGRQIIDENPNDFSGGEAVTDHGVNLALQNYEKFIFEYADKIAQLGRQFGIEVEVTQLLGSLARGPEGGARPGIVDTDFISFDNYRILHFSNHPGPSDIDLLLEINGKLSEDEGRRFYEERIKLNEEFYLKYGVWVDAVEAPGRDYIFLADLRKKGLVNIWQQWPRSNPSSFESRGTESAAKIQPSSYEALESYVQLSAADSLEGTDYETLQPDAFPAFSSGNHELRAPMLVRLQRAAAVQEEPPAAESLPLAARSELQASPLKNIYRSVIAIAAASGLFFGTTAFLNYRQEVSRRRLAEYADQYERETQGNIANRMIPWMASHSFLIERERGVGFSLYDSESNTLEIRTSDFKSPEEARAFLVSSAVRAYLDDENQESSGASPAALEAFREIATYENQKDGFFKARLSTKILEEQKDPQIIRGALQYSLARYISRIDEKAVALAREVLSGKITQEKAEFELHRFISTYRDWDIMIANPQGLFGVEIKGAVISRTAVQWAEKHLLSQISFFGKTLDQIARDQRAFQQESLKAILFAPEVSAHNPNLSLISLEDFQREERDRQVFENVIEAGNSDSGVLHSPERFAFSAFSGLANQIIAILNQNRPFTEDEKKIILSASLEIQKGIEGETLAIRAIIAKDGESSSFSKGSFLEAVERVVDAPTNADRITAWRNLEDAYLVWYGFYTHIIHSDGENYKFDKWIVSGTDGVARVSLESGATAALIMGRTTFEQSDTLGHSRSLSPIAVVDQANIISSLVSFENDDQAKKFLEIIIKDSLLDPRVRSLHGSEVQILMEELIQLLAAAYRNEDGSWRSSTEVEIEMAKMHELEHAFNSLSGKLIKHKESGVEELSARLAELQAIKLYPKETVPTWLFNQVLTVLYNKDDRAYIDEVAITVQAVYRMILRKEQKQGSKDVFSVNSAEWKSSPYGLKIHTLMLWIREIRAFFELNPEGFRELSVELMFRENEVLAGKAALVTQIGQTRYPIMEISKNAALQKVLRELEQETPRQPQEVEEQLRRMVDDKRDMMGYPFGPESFFKQAWEKEFPGERFWTVTAKVYSPEELKAAYQKIADRLEIKDSLEAVVPARSEARLTKGREMLDSFRDETKFSSPELIFEAIPQAVMNYMGDVLTTAQQLLLTSLLQSAALGLESAPSENLKTISIDGRQLEILNQTRQKTFDRASAQDLRITLALDINTNAQLDAITNALNQFAAAIERTIAMTSKDVKIGRGDLPPNSSMVPYESAAAAAKVSGRENQLSESLGMILNGKGVIEAMPEELRDQIVSLKEFNGADPELLREAYLTAVAVQLLRQLYPDDAEFQRHLNEEYSKYGFKVEKGGLISFSLQVFTNEMQARQAVQAAA